MLVCEYLCKPHIYVVCYLLKLHYPICSENRGCTVSSSFHWTLSVYCIQIRAMILAWGRFNSFVDCFSPLVANLACDVKLFNCLFHVREVSKKWEHLTVPDLRGMWNFTIGSKKTVMNAVIKPETQKKTWKYVFPEELPNSGKDHFFIFFIGCPWPQNGIRYSICERSRTD